MLTKLLRWINDRWPLSALIRLGLEEEMPGGASYNYVFGSAALIVFALQIVTGIWQIFYYVPTLREAYNSLSFLRIEVTFGWLIHGLHYWGAQAMIVLVILHMSQVYIWGAYKRPHELQWLLGVALFIVTMAMILTGGVLPWDKQSYWVVEVASSSAGTIPLVGDYIKRFMLGGEVIGQLTISRFFIMHTAILPGILLILAGAHLVALRAVGSAGPFDPEQSKRSGPFWPDQVYMDGLFGTVIFYILIVLSVYPGAPLQGMADPFDSTYAPKPEWNFLFFYQALKYFPGTLEPLATIGIPVLGTLLLVLIPFFDRNPERRPSRRPLAVAGYVIIMGVFITLTIVGHYSTPGQPTGAPAGGPKKSASSAPSPSPAPTAAPAPSPAEAADIKSGSKLFHSQGCTACHKVHGSGGTIGPDLSNIGNSGHTKEWFSDQIRDPNSHFPGSVMPPFSSLSPKQIQALVAYLLSLKTGETSKAVPAPGTEGPSHSDKLKTGKTSAAEPGGIAPAAPGTGGALPTGTPEGKPTGEAAHILGDAGHGAVLFAKNCVECHGKEGTDKVPNPGSTDGTVPPLNPIDREIYNLDPQTFVDHIDRFIQHGSMPAGPHPSLHMLPFGVSNDLTQPEIADIEAYVLKLNGVNRAKIIHPGIQPEHFIIYVTTFFVLAWLILGGLWSSRKKGKDIEP